MVAACLSAVAEECHGADCPISGEQPLTTEDGDLQDEVGEVSLSQHALDRPKNLSYPASTLTSRASPRASRVSLGADRPISGGMQPTDLTENDMSDDASGDEIDADTAAGNPPQQQVGGVSLAQHAFPCSQNLSYPTRTPSSTESPRVSRVSLGADRPISGTLQLITC